MWVHLDHLQHIAFTCTQSEFTVTVIFERADRHYEVQQFSVVTG